MIAEETRILKASPVMVVAAYSSGEVVGTTLLEFDRGLGRGFRGDIVAVTLTDKANVGAAMRLHLFDRRPANSFGADNAALALSAADIAAQGWIYSVDIPAAGFFPLSTTIKRCSVTGLRLPILGNIDDPDLFGILEARAAYTPLTVSDIQISVMIDPVRA